MFIKYYPRNTSKGFKNTSTIAIFQSKHQIILKIGFISVFNIIEIVDSKAVKKYLEEEYIIKQPVEMHNHCVNTAERVIQS